MFDKMNKFLAPGTFMMKYLTSFMTAATQLAAVRILVGTGEKRATRR